MNQLLKRAIDAVEQLPKEEQDEIARLILTITANDAEQEEIASEHLDAVMTGLAQAERGDFASNAEIAATFRRFG